MYIFRYIAQRDLNILILSHLWFVQGNTSKISVGLHSISKFENLLWNVLGNINDFYISF